MTKKKPEYKPKKGKKEEKLSRFRSSWSTQLFTTFIIFLIIISAYSLFDNTSSKPEEISISKIAADISAGTVSTIDVKGQTLDLTYTDETKKTAKKELESSLTESLTNYGVTKESLEKVNISVKNESGVTY